MRHCDNSKNRESLNRFGPHRKTDAGESRSVYYGGRCSVERNMKTSCSRPKRELSPLQRACVSLGLSADAKPKTHLAWLLRKANLGKTAIEYLGVSNDEQAQRIVALYHRLNATERKAVTIDHLVMATGADPPQIWGCISAELYRVAGLLACLNAPRVVKTAIQRALTPDGFQDRRLILQAAGIVPWVVSH